MFNQLNTRISRKEMAEILRPALPALWLIACKDGTIILESCVELLQLLQEDVQGRWEAKKGREQMELNFFF